MGERGFDGGGGRIRAVMRKLARWILGFPLFFKILIANSLLIVMAVVFTASHTLFHSDGSSRQVHWDLMVDYSLVALAIGFLANFLLLKAAFQPLTSLQKTVNQVRKGDWQARTHRPFFSDPQMDSLMKTINEMLDALQIYRNQLQRLSSQVLTAQEEERKRIARELHDQTGQALTSLLVQLRMVERAAKQEDVKRQLSELRQLALQTLDDVRRLALELRPAVLDDLGLVAALQWYTKEYSGKLPIKVDFRAIGFGERLPSEIEVVFYRVVQEALTNIAKHSQATRASILLEHRGRSVMAVVEDNGKGFDVEKVMGSRERGLGLFGMQERIALVGGTFTLDSRPGGGTRVVLEAPLDGWREVRNG